MGKFINYMKTSKQQLHCLTNDMLGQESINHPSLIKRLDETISND